MASFPHSDLAENKLSPAFNLRVGVSSVLELSVRSSEVKALTEGLLEIQKDIIEIRKSTRGPVILILDNVS